jgi:predicted nucleotidyltransferase
MTATKRAIETTTERAGKRTTEPVCEQVTERIGEPATERDLEWIVARILARTQPDEIYVFGSHAKGTAAAASDIDLLVVGPSRLPRAHRGKEIVAALAAFPRRFDILWYTPQELHEECRDQYSFVATIMLTARRLYPRPSPLATVLVKGTPALGASVALIEHPQPSER